MEITGILRNWVFNKKHNVIVGYVFNDNGNKNRPSYTRFNDGDHIHTSSIKTFSEDGKYITTLNSVYELDPPFVEKK